MMKLDCKFHKKQRIYKRKDFAVIFKQGKRFHQPHLMARCIGNGLSYNRLGISVGRKFGNAHQRNLFKRLVREVFRQYPCQQGMDFMFVANSANKTLSWPTIKLEVEFILQKGNELGARKQ